MTGAIFGFYTSVAKREMGYDIFSNSGGGNMNISILGKALLNLYKFLEPMAESIDKMIKSKGFEPVYMASYNLEDKANEILSLTDRKITLINIKVLIDKSIAQLNENNKKIIILRYIDNMSMADICELFNISERTYFRKSKQALESFCNMLEMQNKLHGNLLDEYSRQKWLKHFASNFDDKAEKKDNQLVLCDYLFRQVKQVC